MDGHSGYWRPTERTKVVRRQAKESLALAVDQLESGGGQDPANCVEPDGSHLRPCGERCKLLWIEL
ncbi:hypothetical protein L915_17645 [Phytophthora nicotianae]|uniref:Uncharacterized protein n=1 Tax=Phytophthora nicotianae TaxID=4792 RepID=W2G0R3_PHYNI|nr:hypothetical protein L915_17645 [Phytophthora nicotianae]ETL29228.1 hypothetical protein L916_17540 [Phytophthora nicotianae]